MWPTRHYGVPPSPWPPGRRDHAPNNLHGRSSAWWNLEPARALFRGSDVATHCAKSTDNRTDRRVGRLSMGLSSLFHEKSDGSKGFVILCVGGLSRTSSSVSSGIRATPRRGCGILLTRTLLPRASRSASYERSAEESSTARSRLSRVSAE